MKRFTITMMILLGAFIMCPTTLIARRSKADKERSKRKYERAKERAEKANYQVQNEYEQRLLSDPEFFFYEKIQGKYSLVGDELVPLESIKGDIIQIIDGARVILSQVKLVYRTGVMSAEAFSRSLNSPSRVPTEPITVILRNTEGLVDGEYLSVKVIQSGTYRYITVMGVTKTIKEFKVMDPVTLEQYMNRDRTNENPHKIYSQP
jgi:hypothetical protein